MSVCLSVDEVMFLVEELDLEVPVGIGFTDDVGGNISVRARAMIAAGRALLARGFISVPETGAVEVDPAVAQILSVWGRPETIVEAETASAASVVPSRWVSNDFGIVRVDEIAAGVHAAESVTGDFVPAVLESVAPPDAVRAADGFAVTMEAERFAHLQHLVLQGQADVAASMAEDHPLLAASMVDAQFGFLSVGRRGDPPLVVQVGWLASSAGGLWRVEADDVAVTLTPATPAEAAASLRSALNAIAG